jgi:MIP family channel proteins
MGEFLGSLLFVIFGAGTVAVTGGMLAERLDSARLLVIALAHGLAYMLLVAAMLPISGGHLNPAVTFAAMVGRRMTFTKGMLYMIAQCAGAGRRRARPDARHPVGTHGTLGANALAPAVSMGSGLVTEIVVTFALVSAVLAATMGSTRPAAMGLAGIGLTCVLAHLFRGRADRRSMNPARSFGPAFVAGAWKDQWIFWIAPSRRRAGRLRPRDCCSRPTSADRVTRGPASPGRPERRGVWGAISWPPCLQPDDLVEAAEADVERRVGHQLDHLGLREVRADFLPQRLVDLVVIDRELVGEAHGARAREVRAGRCLVVDRLTLSSVSPACRAPAYRALSQY